MRKSLSVCSVAATLALGACLEKDPEYLPPGGGATDDPTTETDGGTQTGEQTETGDGTDTGTDTGMMCDPPLELCDGQCVDTNSSKEHCGGCFDKCAPPSMKQCVDGMCVDK